MEWIKAIFQAIVIIAVFIGIMFAFGWLISEDNKEKAVRCSSFGEGYEWRNGQRSPDLCVNNQTGEVRYP